MTKIDGKIAIEIADLDGSDLGITLVPNMLEDVLFADIMNKENEVVASVEVQELEQACEQLRKLAALIFVEGAVYKK